MMIKRFPHLVILLALLGSPTLSLAAEPIQPIDSLDVSRYMGRWYEIAKYPNWFQLQCVSDTSAEYRQLSDGNIEVVNQCRTKDGQMDQATGNARQIGEATSPKLKVRFAPRWLSFLPFVWGDYWVIDLDADYQLAVVSEPLREHLWVLSRKPTVEPTIFDALMRRLSAQGFDTSKLERTPQGN